MPPQTTFQQLRAKLDTDADLRAKLDELVIDQASALAAGINNDGVSSQLEFLMSQRNMGIHEIKEALGG